MFTNNLGRFTSNYSKGTNSCKGYQVAGIGECLVSFIEILHVFLYFKKVKKNKKI